MKYMNHPDSDKYRKLLDSDELLPFILNNGNGHIDIHINQSDIPLMQRIISEKKNNSTFKSQKQMKEFITEGMFSHKLDDMLNWRDNAHLHATQEFIISFDESYGFTGYGFVQDPKTKCIKEYKTYDITVVLQRCNTNQFGFDILTAYPSVSYDTPNRIPTNRDLTPVIQQTDKYKQASPIQKAYYEYIANPKNTQPIAFHGTSDKSQDMIELRLTKQHQLHRIRIRDIGITYDILNDPKSRPLKSFRTDVLPMLQKYCPELHDITRQLTNRIDTLNTPSDRGKRAEQKFQDIIDKLSPECQDEPDIT